LIIFTPTEIWILFDYEFCEYEIILGTCIVQKIIISEIDAFLQKLTALIAFYFFDHSLSLARHKQSNQVVVDWSSHLLLSTVSHLTNNSKSYVISNTQSFSESLIVLNLQELHDLEK